MIYYSDYEVVGIVSRVNGVNGESNERSECIRIGKFRLGDKIRLKDKGHDYVLSNSEYYNDLKDYKFSIVRFDLEDSTQCIKVYNGTYEEWKHDYDLYRQYRTPMRKSVWLTLKEVEKAYTKEEAIEKIKELVDKIKK